MANGTDTYDYITEKFNSMKDNYPFLRDKPDYYVFSALFIKAAFYKNPELPLIENELKKIIVDGSNDCGIDILLLDPNSDEKDLIIGQAKFCASVTSEQVLNAVRKMADGYKELKEGRYERANEQLSSRFVELDDKVDEESKIWFVFYTSAPRKRIDIKRIETKFLEEFLDTDNIEVKILFASDVKKEIDEAASWKSIVECGKIDIDKANNCLRYRDDAAIVNVSAFSIKKLYAEHKTNLLSLNLRYHIKERKRDGVDNGIKTTIENNPESFWLKNNGLTIICDDFLIDGREVHLENFSVVNGGQTTYVIDKSKSPKDFWLSCKIIKTLGTTEKEKNIFSLEIAKAANAQKPIKDADLKANAPEQRSFAQSMRAIGIFYQTKRGEKIQGQFVDSYLHTKLLDIGKLCMAAIFQMPCVSRNRKKLFHEDRYYKYIFIDKQSQVAKICKELLYINHYFNKIFKLKFKRENENEEDAASRIHFANKARTICIAFAALAARYHQGNLTEEGLKTIFAASNPQSDSVADDMYKAVRDIGSMQSLFPKKLSENMDLYDAALDKLFTAIIEEGIKEYFSSRRNASTLTENSFLQNDKNYYFILENNRRSLNLKIKEVFAEI